MRISDWSSDVCSSDLGGDAVADLDRHGFDDAASRLPQFLDMADHLAARVGDRHARFDREHARAVCRAGPSVPKLASGSLSRPHGSQSLQTQSPFQIGRATSELQSLMRISYAVFCLN